MSKGTQAGSGFLCILAGVELPHSFNAVCCKVSSVSAFYVSEESLLSFLGSVKLSHEGWCFLQARKKWSCEIIVGDVCHGSAGPAACLEVEQNVLEGEVEVADVQIVLSSSDPGNVFQALWKLLCSCSSSQPLTWQWTDVTLQGWLWALNLSGAWMQLGFVLCLGNGAVALWSRQKKKKKKVQLCT